MAGLPTVVLDLEGQRFEIFGLAYGQVPAWRLIKRGGVEMDHASFMALSQGTQQRLAVAVQQYVNNLNRAGSPAPLRPDEPAPRRETPRVDPGSTGVAATGVAGGNPAAGVMDGVFASGIAGTISTSRTSMRQAEVSGISGGGLDGYAAAADGPIAAQDGTVLAVEEGESHSPPERAVADEQTVLVDIHSLLDQTERDLRTVLPVVRAAAEARAGLGHNHPPSPIDVPPLDAEEVEIGIDAVNVYRTEISKPVPSPQVIELCKKVLTKLRRGLEAFGRWLGEQSHAFVEKIQNDTGVMLAEGLVRWAGPTIITATVVGIYHLLASH